MVAAERLAESALHRLSQPLTAMRCLLEYALEQDEPEVMRDFSERSMQECARLAAMVHAFRELLLMGVRSHETEVLTLAAVQRVAAKAGVPVRNSSARNDVLLRLNSSSLATALWHLRESLNSNATASSDVACECEVREQTVALRWKVPGGKKATAWAVEQETINPFAVVDYDFVGSGIPRLTIVKTIADAMGGEFVCSDDKLELILERAVHGEKEYAAGVLTDIPYIDGENAEIFCSH